MPAALLFLSLIAQQGGSLVEGKPVNLVWPVAQVAQPDSDYLGWRGWAYLNGTPPKAEPAYLAGFDWTQIQSAYEASKNSSPAATWRMRFVILERTETDFRDSNGVLRFDRRWTPDKYLNLAQESIVRLGAWVTAETGGKVKLAPEITVEHEFERADDLGPAFAETYFGPRINGGGYEAEDKVFRGPYHSAIYITPGVDSGATAPTWVNGTPVIGVPLWLAGVPYAPGELDLRLHQAFVSEVEQRLAQRGLKSVSGGATAEGWTEAADLSELPTPALLERLRTPKEVSLGLGSLAPIPVMAWKNDSDQVGFAADPEKGQVLHVAELGAGRNSGLSFPSRADGQPLATVAQTPTLSLSVKSTAQDALGLTLFGADGKHAYVTLGRETNYRSGNPSGAYEQVAFKNDGTWQRLGIDLRPLGLDSVTRITLEPTPMSALRDRRIPEPIVADFDDIRFTTDAPTPTVPALNPDAKSADPEERALFAAKATTASAELASLLSDREIVVRLNAADAYTRIKDPAAVPPLLTAAPSIDPTVGATAVKALAFQGGDSAMEAVRRLVATGLTPYARATAALVLASTKDPKYGADLKLLMTDRSRLTREAAAQALSVLPSKENSILQMAFLMQEDPELTVTVTQNANPEDEYQMRKLLWSAVNEPSDMVRAESDIKLIASANPSFRAEGYKGVRDDSRVTRLRVLAYLAAHPDEAHRGALRLAVTDRSALVRAAAVRGFAALEKGAEADEIANVLEDKNPEVQLALIELAKKRGFKLPEATVAAMSNSPDPRVPAALKELRG